MARINFLLSGTAVHAIRYWWQIVNAQCFFLLSLASPSFLD